MRIMVKEFQIDTTIINKKKGGGEVLRQSIASLKSRNANQVQRTAKKHQFGHIATLTI